MSDLLLWLAAQGLTVIIASIVSTITCLSLLRGLVSRVQAVETASSVAQGIHANMELFRDELKQHQEEDCTRLTELHKIGCETGHHMATATESLKWIKEAIKDDRQHARNNSERLWKAVGKLGNSVAALKPKPPARKKPAVRKTTGCKSRPRR